MSSNDLISQHINYRKTYTATKLMRDSVIGEPALKAKENRLVYLPNPCSDDADKTESKSRYERYYKKAEYDNVPNTTLEALLGAMSHSKNNYDDLPQEMQYLIEDADGDGLSLDELIKLAQSELLQMRYCGLLAEYSDLAGLGIGYEQLTVQQVREFGLSFSMKVYSRESIVNWSFRRINGKKQLHWVLLMEREQDDDSPFNDTVNEDVKSYLLLALDENGQYYQQKYIETHGSGWSDRFYPETPRGPFNFIPFEFAIQGNYPKGEIPMALGYLFPIACKSIARYQVNADMKEALWFSGAPVSWSSGWTDQAFEMYRQMTGKDHIETGPAAHIPLPQDAGFGLMDWKAESSAYFTYLDKNAQEIEAVGGSFDINVTSDEQTATAKAINSAERKGVLSSLQDGLEKSFERVIGYCAMFENQFDVEIDIKLNREFTSSKLTPQERKAILDEFNSGMIPREEALSQLERGGILTKAAEIILSQAELYGE